MDIVDRLKLYMDHTGLQISQFADTALIPRPTLSQILSGRNKKISNEILSKLHNAYPELSIAWLLFGDGNMLSESNAPKTTEPKATPEPPAVVPEPSSTKETEAAKSAPDDVAHENSSKTIIPVMPDTNKKVQTIMVFYSDNSFETFYPARN